MSAPWVTTMTDAAAGAVVRRASRTTWAQSAQGPFAQVRPRLRAGDLGAVPVAPAADELVDASTPSASP